MLLWFCQMDECNLDSVDAIYLHMKRHFRFHKPSQSHSKWWNLNLNLSSGIFSLEKCSLVCILFQVTRTRVLFNFDTRVRLPTHQQLIGYIQNFYLDHYWPFAVTSVEGHSMRHLTWVSDGRWWNWPFHPSIQGDLHLTKCVTRYTQVWWGLKVWLGLSSLSSYFLSVTRWNWKCAHLYPRL